MFYKSAIATILAYPAASQWQMKRFRLFEDGASKSTYMRVSETSDGISRANDYLFWIPENKAVWLRAD
jgi:hypothetical protein